MSYSSSSTIPTPAPAWSLYLVGPVSTARERLALAGHAARVRADGHDVTTSADSVASTAAAPGSYGFARHVADAMLDADALVLAPGWEGDDQAVALYETADAIGMDRFELEAALWVAAMDALPATRLTPRVGPKAPPSGVGGGLLAFAGDEVTI